MMSSGMNDQTQPPVIETPSSLYSSVTACWYFCLSSPYWTSRALTSGETRDILSMLFLLLTLRG